MQWTGSKKNRLTSDRQTSGLTGPLVEAVKAESAVRVVEDRVEDTIDESTYSGLLELELGDGGSWTKARREAETATVEAKPELASDSSADLARAQKTPAEAQEAWDKAKHVVILLTRCNLILMSITTFLLITRLAMTQYMLLQFCLSIRLSTFAQPDRPIISVFFTPRFWQN